MRGDTVNVRGNLGAVRLRDGDHWIGGYELHGDGRTGHADLDRRSASTAPWASFLVGGGSAPRARASSFSLVGEDEPFYDDSAARTTR